jgi:hypothetical protein
MFETSEGEVFTVYDWKYGHELIMNERITFNIGSKDRVGALRGKEELKKLVVEIQGDAVLDRYSKLNPETKEWLDKVSKDFNMTII